MQEQPKQLGPKGPRRHTAWIYDRGGKEMVHQIHNPVEIKYTRMRDEQSTATVKVMPTERDRQLKNLQDIEPGRHELHLFRGNRLAWCGPVNLPTMSNRFDMFELDAVDITRYLDRMAIEGAYDNSASKVDYVVNRLKKILTTEIAAQGVEADWNLLEHLHFYVQSGDARTAMKTDKFSSTIFDHLDDLAARNGIDYTVVGRELHIWDTSRPAMGVGPTIGREDFLSEPKTKKYGAELATRVIATDGQGGFGIAGGRDPYYGKWDIVVQAYDAETDDVKPTADELKSQARLSLNGRNPTPLQLTISSNSQLNPKSALTWEMLTPGLYLPLRLERAEGKPISRMQKLQDVTVVDNADGEVITMSLYPASGYGADDGGTV